MFSFFYKKKTSKLYKNYKKKNFNQNNFTTKMKCKKKTKMKLFTNK